jgi:DNA (cytosine-5)-methyltransferase 1
MNLNRVRIKEAMDLIGIATFTELSTRLGITKNQLSFMLSDHYSPLKARVEELCSVLNIMPSEIMEIGNEAVSDVAKTPYENHTAVTAIELFAGAGGLALGLEKVGIDTVAYIEIDKFCCETLKKNRPLWNVVNSDISTVDFSKYKGTIDIVTGGFPCQAFSYAGKKLGFNDTRGTLFHEFARCVKEVEPTVFMAENVRGLLSHDGGRTFKTIVSVLENLGYDVQHKVLNAAYYGVGQKRERIVIIGTKGNASYKFPVPETEMTTLRTVLKNCPESEGQQSSARKKAVLDLVPPGGCWVDLPLEIQHEYLGKSIHSGGGKRGLARRISWDEPCLTVTCSPSQKQTERCHPDETRPFTVREYARIQSFPDDWEFCGGIGEKYKQIGNAVPVELARRVGATLKESIENFRKAELHSN